MKFDSEFPLDEPPTMPHRTLSGDSLKIDVIRAMAAQQDAITSCSHALDEFVHRVAEKFGVRQGLGIR